jgi:hypothetical protein
MRLILNSLKTIIYIFPMVLAGGMVTITIGQGIIDLPTAIADKTAKVESIKTGLAYCEGPAVDKDGDLFFSEGSSPQNRASGKLTKYN